ncbi:hypothetical protein HYV80_04075 [Candidatus Woesearchaeota archaeon]|nr:hypothetical protein [Candidatus Woesearchaeota archaeon]MBI3027659.1 hypothetical protein [Candidatus Woesearchaeota archaeon]
MNTEGDYKYVPKRKLTEAEKQTIMLKIEKVKLQREQSLLILNKSIMLFFAFFAVAIVGLVNKLVTPTQLNILIIIGVLALVVGVLPYSIDAKKEEKELEKTIDELIN